MLRLVDGFLNKITMYRLVLYELTALTLYAILSGFLGVLPFIPQNIAFSAAFIIVLCLVFNKIFAGIFKTYANVESAYITGFILFLIINPIESFHDIHFFKMAITAAILAMASKYFLAIKSKHIFNPAAVAVVLTSFLINEPASWWVGAPTMVPIVMVVGFLTVRKIRRFDLWLSFMAVSFMAVGLVWRLLVYSPLLFFAFIMLTEPQTAPPTQKLRILYGGFIGVLSVFTTLELALVIGNIFSYMVSPKEKLKLKLKEKVQVASNVYNFVFKLDRKLAFQPGQYMEWTLPAVAPDGQGADRRGNRRYFTIASAPTEPDLVIGTKFYLEPSTFKRQLLAMKLGDSIIAASRGGDFVLPKDKNKKLVFMAGGIGITPFRSMIKYLLDRQEKRDIILLYSNKTPTEVAYTDIFDAAQNELGIKTFYTMTDQEGFIDEHVIRREVPDYKERQFFLSGPHAMVEAFEKTLRNMGLTRSQIKKDYFPGFA